MMKTKIYPAILGLILSSVIGVAMAQTTPAPRAGQNNQNNQSNRNASERGAMSCCGGGAMQGNGNAQAMSCCSSGCCSSCCCSPNRARNSNANQ